MFDLSDVEFTDKNAEDIESAIITMYESLADRTLSPGDPIRLFLEAMAAIIIQQRILIDYAAKQNLLAYSEDDFLDHIGVLVGVQRLAAQAANTTVRFTLSIAQNQAVIIPAGTRVTPGNQIFFATTEAVSIPAGQLQVDIPMQCMTTGTDGNGFVPGQINTLVDPQPWIQFVANITESSGGVDTESDDNLRQRIQQAPERFSTAGPDGAYLYWAKTANQSIIDAAVYSPSAGEVEIRPLLEGGTIPSQEVLDEVIAVCSDKTVRPLTDHVTVLAPEVISYNINLSYWIDRSNTAAAASIQQAVTKAVSDYIAWQAEKLGRDINPSQLTYLAMQAGAKRVNVTEPVYTELESYQVAQVGIQTVAFGGIEDG